MEKRRQVCMVMDELDYEALQKAVARRQTFGRNIPGVQKIGLVPPGKSDTLGGLVAEICRGWLEMLDAASPGGENS